MDWYKRYPKDFLEGTAHMSLEEVGAYDRLLEHQWCRGGRLPIDHERLAMLLSTTPEHFEELWATVGKKFRRDEYGYFNERLERERLSAEESARRRSAAARTAAEARWSSEQDPDAERMRNASESHANRTRQAGARDARLASRFSASAVVSEGGNGGPGERGAGAEPAEHVRLVLAYLNDLAGTSFQPGHDSEYLEERLAEGWGLEACEQAVEAAMASDDIGDPHPRRVFSRRWFAELVGRRRSGKLTADAAIAAGAQAEEVGR